MKRLLVAVLLLLFPVFAIVPSVNALSNYSDNFEDDSAPLAPTAPWYSFSAVGTGDARVSTARSLGAESFLVSDTSAADTMRALFTSSAAAGWDFCFQGSAKFAVNFESFGGGTTGSLFRIASTAGTSSTVDLIVGPAGEVTLEYVAGSTQFATVVLDTWYNITMTHQGCGGLTTVSAYIAELDIAGSLTQTDTCTGCIRNRLLFGGNSISSNPKFYIDNLAVLGVNDPPPTAVGSSATVAVTNLVGFDVDPTGSGVVARTDAGDFIRSYAPKSLTLLGSRDTNCIRSDMVASSDIANVYVVCDAADNRPKFFSIRNFDESVFDFPGNCDPSDDCLDDINFQDDCTFDDEEVLGEISDLAEIPLDYSYTRGLENPLLGDQARAIAFAYSTTNGYVGVFQYTTRDGANACNEERIQFGGSAPEQICVWQPSDASEDTIIGAVDSAGATKLYTYRPITENNELDGTLLLRTTLSPTGGVAISCAGDYVLIVTNAASSNVHLVNINSGTEESGFPITITDEKTRGAFLTADTEMFAVVDGSSAKFGNRTNATIFGGLTLPAGTFKAVQANHGGQDWWIATTSVIAYYDAYTAFPFIGAACVPSCTAPEAEAEVDGLAGRGVLIGEALGIGGFGGNLLGAFLLMFITGAGVAQETKKPIGWLIGAAAGLVMAWAFSFVEEGAIFTIVLVIGGIILLGVRARANRSG